MEMSVTFEVTFCVRADIDTSSGETVCIVGDCDRLGNWDPHHGIRLSRVSSPRPPRKTDVINNITICNGHSSNGM
jgi:hypothetical protein